MSKKQRPAVTLIPIERVMEIIKKRLGLKKLSRTSVYFYIKERGFPRPLDFGIPRMWRRPEVDAWLDEIIKGETK